MYQIGNIFCLEISGGVANVPPTPPLVSAPALKGFNDKALLYFRPTNIVA